jgi:hypothetical protein
MAPQEAVPHRLNGALEGFEAQSGVFLRRTEVHKMRPAMSPSTFRSLCCVATALATSMPAVHAEDGDGGKASAEQATRAALVLEADAYYTSIGYHIPLTDTPIPTITADQESAMYRALIKGALIPRYMMLEASIYPLPWLFTYIKSDMPDLYRRAEIGHSGINLFESATAGFQEPWALSVFFGNVARLHRADEKQQGANWGYTGYLLSAGNQHIKDNTLVADDWYELEWKIKGRREFSDQKLDWSFRVGAKFNANPDVNDVMYVGLHRSNIDFGSSVFGWLANTNYDLRIHSLQQGGDVVRVELIAGKNVPLPAWGFTPMLDVGFVWTSPEEYAGALRDARGNELTLVFRPSIAF